MTLTKKHRETLISKLIATHLVKQQVENRINNFDQSQAVGLLEGYEIDKYLALEKIRSINKALIDNEIDY